MCIYSDKANIIHMSCYMTNVTYKTAVSLSDNPWSAQMVS